MPALPVYGLYGVGGLVTRTPGHRGPKSSSASPRSLARSVSAGVTFLPGRSLASCSLVMSPVSPDSSMSLIARRRSAPGKPGERLPEGAGNGLDSPLPSPVPSSEAPARSMDSTTEATRPVGLVAWGSGSMEARSSAAGEDALELSPGGSSGKSKVASGSSGWVLNNGRAGDCGVLGDATSSSSSGLTLPLGGDAP